jgi:hypothetical protein
MASPHYSPGPHAKSLVHEFAPKTVKRNGASAYARAARRYGFETDTFAAREGVVFLLQTPAEDVVGVPAGEVPVNDIQNGKSIRHWCFGLCIGFLLNPGCCRSRICRPCYYWNPWSDSESRF